MSTSRFTPANHLLPNLFGSAVWQMFARYRTGHRRAASLEGDHSSRSPCSSVTITAERAHDARAILRRRRRRAQLWPAAAGGSFMYGWLLRDVMISEAIRRAIIIRRAFRNRPNAATPGSRPPGCKTRCAAITRCCALPSADKFNTQPYPNSFAGTLKRADMELFHYVLF